MRTHCCLHAVQQMIFYEYVFFFIYSNKKFLVYIYLVKLNVLFLVDVSRLLVLNVCLKTYVQKTLFLWTLTECYELSMSIIRFLYLFFKKKTKSIPLIKDSMRLMISQRAVILFDVRFWEINERWHSPFIDGTKINKTVFSKSSSIEYST